MKLNHVKLDFRAEGDCFAQSLKVAASGCGLHRTERAQGEGAGIVAAILKATEDDFVVIDKQIKAMPKSEDLMGLRR